jgi:N,N'-diacetyllegionaminate synthase
MVKAIRNIEKAMGTEVKEPSPSETKNIAIARKSIVAKRSIEKGEILTEDCITAKRPGTGVSPMKWFEIVGTAAIKNFKEDELIEI